ncbi:polysaccharide biosynthesis/export family protein [Acuticoccus kandeliae]|uniref:polysaccharide biosynthesis/export family protein n=1 Tax=Acuticoccus kandeliae TaxID=2073160 RepID=UPI000D3E71C5|nr:polysaccharide biosynthesis/export family protein [Acuticoccus kandeliae]
MSPARPVRLASALLLALASLALPGVASEAAAQSGGYTLHARDQIEVKVGQWDAVARQMKPMEWLSGEHAVGLDGMVDLPAVGNVAAEGLTPSALSEEARNALRERLGLLDDLFVSVRIVEHAPIFVVGAVEKPGTYPYVPGLNTLQAIAVAGGVRRSTSLFSRTDRDAVRALGDHRLLEVERWRMLVRIARLEAELAGEENVPLPQELDGVAMSDQLLSVEQEILKARLDDHNTALTSILELKDLLHARIAKMQQEMDLRRELLDRTKDEQDAVSSLVERGLSRNSQINSVRREVTELEARQLEIEGSILTAEQQLNEAERDEIELRGDRRIEIVTELRDARTELNRIEVRTATADALFAEAARFGSTVSDLASQAQDRTPTFVVTRGGEREPRVFEAIASTVLQPGDVIEVRAPEIDQAPTLGASSLPPRYGAGADIDSAELN